MPNHPKWFKAQTWRDQGRLESLISLWKIIFKSTSYHLQGKWNISDIHIQAEIKTKSEEIVHFYLAIFRDGSVWNISTSGGRQCKTTPILGIPRFSTLQPNMDVLFIRNSLNAIVFNLHVILLIMEVTEKWESSYCSLSYGDRHPSYSTCFSYFKNTQKN